jgi:hypothetical protein
MMIRGPLLAVLVALAVPAAADFGDAAFATPLESFAQSAAPIFAHQKSGSKRISAEPAEPAAPAVIPTDSQAWQKLIVAVKKDGKYKPGQHNLPATYTLVEAIGDAKSDHVVRIVSFLGDLNDHDQFKAESAILRVMTFTRGADGNMTIEQWGIETDVYGEVSDASHDTMVQDKNGKPLSEAVDKTLMAGDPRIKAQLDALVGHWAKRE